MEETRKLRAASHRNDPGHMPRNNWNTLCQGLPRQATQARKLHRLAGVAEGPCGLPELEVFQRYLAPHYQLKVMSRQKPFFIIFRGPDAPHLIMLLKGGNHYEGCTTFSGFLKKRYWCHLCDKGVSNKNTHACEGRTWRTCHHRNREQPNLLSSDTLRFHQSSSRASLSLYPWGLWPLFSSDWFVLVS